MKRNTIIALAAAASVIAILSIWLGFIIAGRNSNDTVPSSPPYNTPVAEQVSSNTIIAEPAEEYKIILEGTTLILHENGNEIRKTQISPDVLPRADIKALTTGIAYSDIEKALTDWESLCD